MDDKRLNDALETISAGVPPVVAVLRLKALVRGLVQDDLADMVTYVEQCAAVVATAQWPHDHERVSDALLTAGE